MSGVDLTKEKLKAIWRSDDYGWLEIGGINGGMGLLCM